MSESQSGYMERVAEALRGNRRFLVTTHVRPDGDAVGSLLAMAHILRCLGKDVEAVAQDAVPPNLLFLPEAEFIRHEAGDPSSYDAAVLVDCGDLQRVGPVLEATAGSVRTIVNIDHHVNEAPFGHVHWVWTGASSTCEMLFDLARLLGVALDADLATQLYVGLVTDTGSFRYSNTNRKTLDMAAELVAAGASPYRVAEEVFDSSSPGALKLLSRVLSTVLFLADERLATVELTGKMFEETGSTQADSEGIINHLRSVRSVRLAITFREGDDGLVYVSLRSKGNVDVAALARGHGGGGHRNAAGCRLAGSIAEVRERITKEAMACLS